MVNVKIRRVRAVTTTLAGASSLAMLANGAGCAAPHEEQLGGDVLADTQATPGSGTLTLNGAWQPAPSAYSFLLTQSTTDEFVRVGETLSLDLPGYYLWTALHPDGGDTPDFDHLSQLAVTVEIQLIRRGEITGRVQVHVASWSGDQEWNSVAHTTPFTVPDQVDTLAFGVIVVDPQDGDRRAELASLDFATFPVFGGELPLKHALFDNDWTTLRQRIVEGGPLVAGASAMLTYSDWRADEIVDKTSIDREIGTIQSYGRFGPVVTPIYGDIAYEIGAGFSFDDQSWASDYALPATTSSRVIDLAGRTAYEGTIYVPANATKVDLYFHVKAFLVVDYTKYGNAVISRRYSQGDRILVRERWDNPDGKSYANYVLPVSP